MVGGKIMNPHHDPIKRALEGFCREYAGSDTGWHVKTWLHPITGSVQSVIVMPEFASLGITKRQNVINDYLESHLPAEHNVHLALTLALTPEEYERTEWVPDAPALTLAQA
jgi:acid stress-induced BolA-like protein IbaG/YrbA